MSKSKKPEGIWTGDCLELLPRLGPESVQLIVTDPPYNIGFNYDGEYDDKRTPEEYQAFTSQWLFHAYSALAANGSCWIVIGDEWVSEVDCLAKNLGFRKRSHVIWYYTFGVNCTNKFTRSHAHLLYYTKSKKDFVFNADAIKIPSARQLIYKDKRAKAGGRLPDDTWITRPQDLQTGFDATSDTWHVPRVCGTHKARRPDAANQLPEHLVGRIIRCCSNPGDLVLDPMAGTGTVPVVAKKLGRIGFGIELSEKYATMAAGRLAGVANGDPLDGTIPQGA